MSTSGLQVYHAALKPSTFATMASKLPLPPRPSAGVSSSGASESADRIPRTDTVHLTPYTKPRASSPQRNHPYLNNGGFNDPRSSSTQSLHPVESAGPDRRTLLIIYLHGFLGDETSFRSFPAHVHNLLTAALTQSHAVYSKIYPRYKSRNNITVARDNFSTWLEPHESPKTDVVLVGHSLGGILGAEVVLLPSTDGSDLRHHILGLAAVDVPFLGMHPGVVGTGIASLFRAAPSEQEPSAAVSESLSDLGDSPSDLNFNPAYTNDVRLGNRQTKFDRGWYFFNKHWGELTKATASYVTSHLEFGGCLADYPALQRRYDAIRALEDVDDFKEMQYPSHPARRRVRFVNYYSASTGRIKERAKSPRPRRDPTDDQVPAIQPLSLEDSRVSSKPCSIRSPNSSPRISLEEYREEQIIQKDVAEAPDHPPQYSPEMASVEPHPIDEMTHIESQALDDQVNPGPPHVNPGTSQASTSDNELPPLPQLPTPPRAFDESRYADKDTMKLAQKEHAKQVKNYQRAEKDLNKIVRDRQKLIEKRAKQAQKERGKAAKVFTREQQKLENQQLKSVTTDGANKQLSADSNAVSAQQKQKDRKFCMLPSKDPRTGERDPTWVRVYMEGIDEVVAHTSMFKPSEPYAQLVGDTVARIEEWVRDDATRRAMAQTQELD